MRPTQRITTSIIAAITIALATSATSASARPFDLKSSGSIVPAYTSPVATDRPANTPPKIVSVAARDSGFDWEDAAIGAAGGVAISMIGLSGALVISQRRGRSGPALTS